MSEEIIKVLDYITDKLGIVVDWTTENALPYVEEVIGKFVTYKVVNHSIGLLIGFLMLVGVLMVIKTIKKSYSKCVQTQNDTFFWEYYSSGVESCFEALFPIGLITSIFALVTVAVIGSNLSDLLQWTIIPELGLLEEIKLLLN